MNNLTPGLMCFHNGRPVELIALVTCEDAGETWLCKPLFVADQPNRTEIFRHSDTVTKLHTQFR
jgi:hypothetical protein